MNTALPSCSERNRLEVDHAIACLQRRSGTAQPGLSDSQNYLVGLSESERVASGLSGWGEREPLASGEYNMSSIVGDGESLAWPPYRPRLETEPELVVVDRNAQRPVADCCIFTDVSARDVQASAYPGVISLGK